MVTWALSFDAESLTQLENVTIPRCFKQDLSDNICCVELHNFLDASRDGVLFATSE